ncbi:hypothetical protein [Shinella sp.]|uniref:hypothetical protein n=1 Tax=Shinella sp. TaxID=1870904 RepID=UPI003F70A56E
MRILRMERASPVHDATYSTIATFDIELSPHVRVSGMRLVEAADGTRLSYGPNAGSKRSVTFSREAAAQITEIAVRELEKDRKSDARIAANN